MKKLVLAVLFLFMAAAVRAEQLDLGKLVEKLDLKQGMAYSIADSKVNFLSTVEVANWKNVSLEVGYAGVGKDTCHKIVSVVSYPLIKLDKYVKIPVLSMIEVNAGIYAGFGRLDLTDGQGRANNEFDYGVSLSLFKVHF